MKQTTVLIWEQSSIQAAYWQSIFEDAACQVQRVEGYLALRKALKAHLHQAVLVIISVHTSTRPGYLRSLHQLAPLACLVVIDAEQDLSSHLEWLQAGADAYFAKPIQADQLQMTARALIRQVKRVMQYQTYAPSSEQWAQGDFVLDLNQQCLQVNELSIKLNKREFALLHYFCRHPNQIIERARLHALLWPQQENVKSRQLDNLVLGLRRKLAATELQIDSHYGQGYLLQLPSP